ncbi:phage terminase small subunit P27 family [Cupriavidus basilensis]|uniref:Phage terminase small subunit P27 family n=1 Tax=Cupriavidus basilensis TaxID=68895 RepID=A0ABT6AWY1_9BURK|nr:phage terminase small subunit P27 family [Cupriavidus basilensis]MDF3837141.1 phage terminase small subunit P27 family [Cupriavidus basilensis]
MAGVAGRSGRKPKPTARKALAGNPGKRALNRSEPDFGLVTTIFAPDWLEGHARDLWEHLAPLLCKQHILQATDIQNLEVYCAAYGQFRKAEEDVARNGQVVAGAQGGPIKNPALTAKNEAVKQMVTYGALLGLDPSSRQRLLGPKKKGEGNPFAALLG